MTMENQAKQEDQKFKWLAAVCSLIFIVIGGANLFNFLCLYPDCKALMLEIKPNYDANCVIAARGLLENPECRSNYEAFRLSDGFQPIAILQFMAFCLFALHRMARKRKILSKSNIIWLSLIFIVSIIYAINDWLETPALTALLEVPNSTLPPESQLVETALRITTFKSISLAIAVLMLGSFWIWIRFRKAPRRLK